MVKNKYTAIACINNLNCIGNGGKLLYHIKADMENFKSLTTGNVVIMGRKTFESLPGGKPLKNRINIIMTRDDTFSIPEDFEDCYIVSSWDDVNELCAAFFSDRELFIIGGAEIYRQAYEMGYVKKAILTVVNDDAEGDAYFPDILNDPDYMVRFRTTSLRGNPNDDFYRYVILEKR